MRPLNLFIITTILIIGCKTDQDKIQNADAFWKEVCYPIDSIGSGKTFVMQKVDDTSVRFFVDLRIEQTATDTVLVMITYDSFSRTDSTRLTLNYEPIASYSFISMDKIGEGPVESKTEMLKVISDGTTTGKRISKVVSRGSESTYTFFTEETYLKDTIFAWKGKNLPCVVTTTKTRTKIKSVGSSSNEPDIMNRGTDYYVKGLGIVRWSHHNDEGGIDFQLVDIVEMPR